MDVGSREETVDREHIQILVELMREWVFRPIGPGPGPLKEFFAVSTDQETRSFSSGFRNGLDPPESVKGSIPLLPKPRPGIRDRPRPGVGICWPRAAQWSMGFVHICGLWLIGFFLFL
jgi:hypothetical protein